MVSRWKKLGSAEHIPFHHQARVVLLLLGALGYWIGARQSPVVLPQFKAIAVLPLQNYSGDPQQEYFVDGMTDSVIADLGKIRDMTVISRTSVMPFKNSKKSLREIANELHADAVIEPSVLTSKTKDEIIIRLSGQPFSCWPDVLLTLIRAYSSFILGSCVLLCP